MVLSGSDAGVGASGRAARDFPRAVHNPRSRRRHPAWLGRHAGVELLLHRTGHGVAALPLHRLSGKKRRLFETPLSGRAKAGLIASALGVVAGVLLTQSTDCVSLGEWTMGR